MRPSILNDRTSATCEVVFCRPSPVPIAEPHTRTPQVRRRGPEEVSRKTQPVKIPAPVPHTGPHWPSRRAVAAVRVLGTDTKMELRHEIRIPTVTSMGRNPSCRNVRPVAAMLGVPCPRYHTEIIMGKRPSPRN